jgi:hypothetical protein
VHLFSKEKKDLKEAKANIVILYLKKNKSQNQKFSHKKCLTFHFFYQMKIIGLLRMIKITSIKVISRLVGLKKLYQQRSLQR